MHDAQTAAGDAVSDETVTAIRTCPLCEAGCGLSIEVTNGSIGRTRGDRLDVFSHGFLCPKGSTLGHLHDDPDRLRQPLVRRAHERVFVVEQNRDGQLRTLMLKELELDAAQLISVLHYDGTPITARLIGP